MVSVSTITCSWNGKKFLKDWADALKKQSYRDFEVILVDNGSTDGTSDFIKRYYPWIKRVRNEKNLGFSSRVNRGVEETSGDIVILLNTDAIPEKGFLIPFLSGLGRAVQPI